jgi:putative PIN family toxin of toxin-antitoxin system
MIRAVLDANVIVSAVLSPAGIPAQILDACRDERFALLISPAMLEEMARVLEYPKIAKLHRWPRARVEEFVAEFGGLGIMTPGDLRLNIVRDDRADTRYLECPYGGEQNMNSLVPRGLLDFAYPPAT